MLQVSPTDGLTSLTQIPPGRPLRPVRLRPSGERFVRLTPNDLLLTEVLLELMRERGTERLAVIFDQEFTGAELAAQIVARARATVPTRRRGGVPRQGRRDPDIVDRAAAGDPNAVVIAGVAGPGTGRMRGDRRAPAGCAGLRDERDAERVQAADLVRRRASRRFPGCPRASCLPPAPMSSGAPAARQGRGGAARGGVRLRRDAPHPRRRRGGGRPRAGGRPAALAMRDRRGVTGPYRLRGTGDVEGSGSRCMRWKTDAFASSASRTEPPSKSRWGQIVSSLSHPSWIGAGPAVPRMPHRLEQSPLEGCFEGTLAGNFRLLFSAPSPWA